MTAADEAVKFALAQVGKPYVWGATGPNSYDCSGLTQAAYKSAGITLLRTTYLQVTQGSGVAQKDLKPGDLVFPDPGHVQMYLGNGMIVEAPQAGENVRVTSMWGFWKARRIVAAGGTVGSSNDPKAPYPPATLKAPLSVAQKSAILAYMQPLYTSQKLSPPWDTFSKYSDGALINQYNYFASHGTTMTGDPGAVDDMSDPKNIGKAVSSLGDTVGKILTAVSGLQSLVAFITDGKNWYRVALFVLGLLLLVVALIRLVPSNVKSVVTKGLVP
jgi:hypothetical protein